MHDVTGSYFRAKADREATRILDEYGELTGTREGVHALLSLAFMLGSKAGSDEAMAFALAELRKAL